MSIVIATTRAVQPGPVERIRADRSRAIGWTPTDRQLRRMALIFFRTCTALDWCIKVAVIAAALYLAIEIGLAFLPGGAVSRVLGGLR
jgi:hypothetical protein